ncbi:MAG: alpha-D-xyloside xylohydrolase [Solirubrobacteraceae bacterium]|nr:alpha-D-xyloside xylohydrolase [Solirubrobacteraceae bacterium]
MAIEISAAPDRVESSAYRAYAILHERLVPYVRAAAATAARTGLPIVRPLCLTDPEDPRAWTISDAYGYGPALWVAPVLDDGAREREVALPRGDWVESWSGELVRGGGETVAPGPTPRHPGLGPVGVDRGHLSGRPRGRRPGGPLRTRPAARGDPLGGAPARPGGGGARRRDPSTLAAGRLVGGCRSGGGVRRAGVGPGMGAEPAEPAWSGGRPDAGADRSDAALS